MAVLSKILTICLLAFAYIPYQAKASNSCQYVFQLETRVLEFLDLKQLSRYQLKVNEKNELIDLADNNNVIGVLGLRDPVYLFEWAPKDYHDIWVHNKGIFTQDMIEILKEAPQAAGRGYYVSTNPFDSTSYGDALTVFKSQGPIVTLSQNSTTIDASTNFMIRLQKAGIDAIQMRFSPTWLNIINSKHLKIAKGIDFSNYINSPSDKQHFLMRFSNFENSKFLNSDLKIPELEILKKIKNDKIDQLSEKEINFFTANRFEFLKTLDDKSETFWKLLKVIKNQLWKDHLSNNKADQLEELKQLFEFVQKRMETLTNSETKIGAHSTYSNLLKYIDLKTVFLFSQGKPIEELSDFNFMKSETQKSETAYKNIKLNRIINFDIFMKYAGQLIGESAEFRTERAIMAAEIKTDQSRLLIKTDLETAKTLMGNGLLTVKVKTKVDQKLYLEVEYTDLLKLKTLVSKLPLSKKIVEYLNKSSVEELKVESLKNRNLLKSALQELTIGLFSSVESQKKIISTMQGFESHNIQALDIYKALMSLHPFAKGNGRIGRLFYDVMNIQSQKQDRILLPVFDLDLFSLNPDLSKFVSFSKATEFFVNDSKSDEDFFRRVQFLMKVFVDQNPTMTSVFPELNEYFK